jgi:hypothetical protein
MSHALWLLFETHSAQVVNALALFLALAGSWLLLATRLRQQQATVRLALETGAGPAPEAVRKINRFFQRFGAGCLLAALLVSGLSTSL